MSLLRRIQRPAGRQFDLPRRLGGGLRVCRPAHLPPARIRRRIIRAMLRPCEAAQRAKLAYYVTTHRTCLSHRIFAARTLAIKIVRVQAFHTGPARLAASRVLSQPSPHRGRKLQCPSPGQLESVLHRFLNGRRGGDHTHMHRPTSASTALGVPVTGSYPVGRQLVHQLPVRNGKGRHTPAQTLKHLTQRLTSLHHLL